MKGSEEGEKGIVLLTTGEEGENVVPSAKRLVKRE